MAPADVVAWLHHEPVQRLRGTGGHRPRETWPTGWWSTPTSYERVTGVRLFPGSLNVVMAGQYRLPPERLRLEPC
jgi:hypothetical protein